VLSQIAMPALESFWFPGANHDRVQGFLLKPPEFAANRKYPVKFLIHGGPENALGVMIGAFVGILNYSPPMATWSS
jgi:dipeptidyl aminopeptidase/acylaminoacyl peptidase